MAEKRKKYVQQYVIASVASEEGKYFLSDRNNLLYEIRQNSNAMACGKISHPQQISEKAISSLIEKKKPCLMKKKENKAGRKRRRKHRGEKQRREKKKRKRVSHQKKRKPYVNNMVVSNS